ncbi:MULTISPECIES: malonic semialdehyde reductase [unclassified Novosphingobium]|uniref:malonic semialdehyde reductase n=1 Tax=unclassified Novosphingobium TaxID=2644732 RepID=UPI000EC7EE2F|nr:MULTISPECIES: malonic semialdehyde reductase [unclassified Novosphingobium]HCF24302.1 malonic semialdehyde reductase [Novosphingobium sp.]HQV04880.1 malonic semialdehyde reductase [Novosphingobium sp.]
MTQPLADAALDQLFLTARTYNGYLDKPVSTEQLHAIWDLTKMGPTSANQLPARLVWITSDEAKQKLAACTMPANGEKILKAPVSVIIAMDLEFHEQLPWLFPHTDARAWFVGNDELRKKSAFLNTTLQGAYFIMAARALGLDTGPMTGFSNEAVDAAFFADQPNYKSVMLSTLGYGDPASIFERSPRPDFDTFNSIL